MKNYDAQKTQISWGYEWPDFVDLTGGTVTGSTVTGLSGLTVNRYNGQMAIVMARAGSLDGVTLHVVSNTATVITFEEDVATLLLAATDVLSIMTKGKLPADTTEVWANVLESDLPEPAVTTKDEFAHGSTNHPQRKASIRTGIAYEATLSLDVVNGKTLMLATGKCTDVASAYGVGATTSTRDVEIGELIISVASAADFLANDFIEIGDNSGGSLNEGSEIRKITAINTTFLTLNFPVRRFHPSGCAIKETDISTTDPVTHTLEINPNLWGFCLEAVWKGFDPNQTVNDLVVHYTGLEAKSLQFKSGQEPLVLELGVNGLDALKDQRTRATIDQTDYLNDPYLFDQALVTINSVDFGQTENLAFGTERGMTDKFYHNVDTGIKPYEHSLGKPKHTLKIDTQFHNKTFWDLVEDGTEFDVTIKFTRTATDTITFLYEDCVSDGAPLKFPEEGEIIQSNNFNPGKLTATVVDAIEFY